MARYIQDYIYAELPEDFIPDVLQWFEVGPYDELPTPSKDYFLTIAVKRDTDNVSYFLCDLVNGSYVWRQIFDKSVVDRLVTAEAEIKTLKGKVDYPILNGVYALSVTSEGHEWVSINDTVNKLVEDKVNALLEEAIAKAEASVDEKVEAKFNELVDETIEKIKAMLPEYPEHGYTDSEGNMTYSWIADKEDPDYDSPDCVYCWLQLGVDQNGNYKIIRLWQPI